MTQAQESGPYGAGFLFNEGPRKVNIYQRKIDMQGYQGLMGISFKAGKNGCWNVQAFSKYGHSWSSTRATGFNIGQWSVGVTWTHYNHNWQQASQPSREVRVCRS